MQRAPLIVGIVVTATMAAAIVYGFAACEFGDEFGTVADMAWGRVSLIDLAAGLVLMGGWITWREGSVGRALPWWVALVVTGNLASGVYVIQAAWRAPSFAALLTGDRGSVRTGGD